MADETKTLILEMRGEKDRKLIIPADWTITFGPIGIGTRHDGNDSTHALRLYADAGKKDLKAVFRNIVAFHEEGITILEKIVRKKNKTFKKAGTNGDQVYAAEIRNTVWANPYADEVELPDDGFEVTEDALALTHVDDGAEPF